MDISKQIKVTSVKGKTKKELEKELLEEGYCSYEWTDSPGAYYSPHHHDYDECICIINGTMTFIVDKNEYAISFGEKLYLPAFTIHESKNKEKEEVVYLVGEKK